MRKIPRRKGLLVCVELGATWPERLVAGCEDAVRRVVAQVDGETPEAFAARVGSLGRRLFSDGIEIRDVLVACNERTDPAATRARRTLGSRLLERLGPMARLAFSASPRAGGRSRHALSALALDLAPAASARVTVHFGGDDEAPSEPAALRVA